MLTNQGIIVSPNMQPPPVSPNQQTQNQLSPDGVSHPLSHSESMRSKRSDSMKWKQHNPPSSTSSSTLPINLISATNQQKVNKTKNKLLIHFCIIFFIILIQVASKVQIKQKLPFKLANKLSSSNVNTTAEPAVPSSTVTSPSQTAYAIQQLLPLKLRESAKNPLNPIQGSLNEILSPSNQQAPSHSRTGSSPAMMQTAQVPF